MISQQKGFFFAIFASSIILSALLILSFMAFVFRMGFATPGQAGQMSNYDLMHSIQGHLHNATWETPLWSGRFSIGAIHSMISEETKFFKNLT